MPQIRKDYLSLVPPARATSPQHASELAIPKRLHQIYIGADERSLAPEMKANIQQIQATNSDWEYRLWDEASIERFIFEVYGAELLRYYRMISPLYRAAQADFARYLIIYHYGGVYLDIKASFERPLSEVLDLERDAYILYHWDNEPDRPYAGFGLFPELDTERFPYGEYPQTFVIARPGHPLLQQIIAAVMERLDSYSPFVQGVGLRGVLRTTGPLVYSQVVDAYKRTGAQDYRQLRCIEELGGRYSIYDAGGAFAHRQKLSNYHNQLSAVSLNGSERWTKWLHGYFWLSWTLRVLGDKLEQRFGK